MGTPFEEILGFVETLEIYDTHEHLPHREDARERSTDVLQEYLKCYFSSDLQSAGLRRTDYQAVIDPRRPLAERWRLVEPYWQAARFTGYGQALDIVARGLYGVDGITGATIERLNERFQATLAGGQYRRVLKEKSRIRLSILDANLDCDPEYFRSAYNLDLVVMPRNLGDVEQVAGEAGVRVACFDDWLEACRGAVARAEARGAVCLKTAHAYARSLAFERWTRAQAEEAFNGFFDAIHRDSGSMGAIPGKPLQDFVMHWVLQEADRRGRTVQVHTGILEGTGNYLANSDPLALSNLFLQYPDVKFDLFHIGYPWQQQVGVLAKNFPNVFIDMCWAHIVSPTASVVALAEWVGCVPLTKISAFGGDYSFVDGVYGHQAIARRNVSRSLARTVEEGVMDIDAAKATARMLFIDNPRRLFGLPA